MQRVHHEIEPYQDKLMKNRTIWLFTLVTWWLAAAPVCCLLSGTGTGSGGSHYWTHGCVSANQAVLGAVGDEAAQVDLETGEIRQQEVAYFDEVLCMPDGAVIALARRGLFSIKEAAWLEKWDKAAGRWQVVGPLPDHQVVTYYRRILTGSDGDFQRYDGPLTLTVSTLGRVSTEQETVELPPELFPELGEGTVNYFLTQAVRILADERVLVVAGFRPDFSFGQVEPLPWGFFTVDLTTGNVASLGPTRTGDDILNLRLQRKVAATPDGQIQALALIDELNQQGYVIGLRADTPEETFRTPIEAARQVNQLALTQTGELAAVVFDNVELYVLEGQTGQILWQAETGDDSINHIEFLDDDSLVIMTANRTTSRREGQTGQVVWTSQAHEMQP